MSLVELSPLDLERFGVPTAKAIVKDPAEARAAIETSRGLGARLLMVRCPAEHLQAAQVLEELGCRVMDVLVYYAHDLRKPPIPVDTNDVAVRGLRPEDADRVEAVARESFKGYFGHYHADPRVDSTLADEVYVSWAHRSCVSREVAAEVLIADDGDALLGFFTLRRNSENEGEGVLCGVAPAAQGRGIYRSFMIRGMEWCAQQGLSSMVVSTQLTNIAVQKVWSRLGFEPQKSYLTFHKWLDYDGTK
jgi:GNAT superfamily N-acetyltransferase